MGNVRPPNFKLSIGALIYIQFILFSAGCSSLVQGTVEPSISDHAFQAPPEEAYNTLREIENVNVPQRDLVALGHRFGNVVDLRHVARDQPEPFNPGDSAWFWYKNHETGENIQSAATLQYRSDHINLWTEEGFEVDQKILLQAANEIEEQILPTSRAFFGNEWQPGVDGDMRINILHVADLGGGTVGYFSQADEFVADLNRFSNERELIYVNLNNAPVGSDQYYHVIAHEMQHMIHWKADINEAVWVNEGLSELSSFLNGYINPDYFESYLREPDTQLTDFNYDDTGVNEHYGASFLFFAFFLEQYGEEATRSLVFMQEDGLVSIDNVLEKLDAGIGFEDFFARWVVANYLDGIVDDQEGFHYQNLDLPRIEPAVTTRRFPASGQSTVRQYGADYLVVRGNTPVTFVFTGTRQVPLSGADPQDGQYYWSSFPADNSDMTLTKEIDLSHIDKATLRFLTWYDHEEGWDYSYVAVSTDEGHSWQPLASTSSTDSDPQGNSFGPAFTGVSGGGDAPSWVEESVDLSPYSGQTILLRFETINDDTVHNQGFAIDNIAIPEIGFFDDSENGPGDWLAEGFIRHTNTIPQRFILQMILFGEDTLDISRLELDEDQTGHWQLPFSDSVEEAVIVISGIAPATNHPAGYFYEILSAR